MAWDAQTTDTLISTSLPIGADLPSSLHGSWSAFTTKWRRNMIHVSFFLGHLIFPRCFILSGGLPARHQLLSQGAVCKQWLNPCVCISKAHASLKEWQVGMALNCVAWEGGSLDSQFSQQVKFYKDVINRTLDTDNTSLSDTESLGGWKQASLSSRLTIGYPQERYWLRVSC